MIRPSPEYLRERLDYDPETGALTWKANAALPKGWNTKHAGDPAFTRIAANGYRVSSIDGRPQLAHRIAWALHHGAWPTHEIDHINGNKADNRISNLRDIPHVQNQRNMCRHRSNTSGVNGVSFHKRDKRYRAYIEVNGRSIHLGNFRTIEDAATARKSAEREQGFMPEHGKVAA